MSASSRHGRAMKPEKPAPDGLGAVRWAAALGGSPDGEAVAGTEFPADVRAALAELQTASDGMADALLRLRRSFARLAAIMRDRPLSEAVVIGAQIDSHMKSITERFGPLFDELA